MSEKTVDVEARVMPPPPSKTKSGFLAPPLSKLERTSDAVRNFSPSLFIASTCTGLIAILIYANPYLGAGWAVPLAWAVWWISTVQFFMCLAMTLARMYYHWDTIANLPASQSPDLFFFGAIGISLAILCEGFLRYMSHYLGSGFHTAGVVVWWLSASLSTVLNVGIPFLAFFHHSRTFDHMMPIWIVGFVPCLVTGLVGPIVAFFITDIAQGRHIVYMSYILLGMSFPVIFMMVGTLVARLLFHGLPPRPLIVSLFFPAAPFTLMGMTLVELAEASVKVFPAGTAFNPHFNFADPGLLSALMAGGIFFFGAAIWWAMLASVAVVVGLFQHKGLPYTIAWWGGVFPLGLMGLTALRLGVLLNIDALTIVGTVLSLFTLIMYLVCCYSLHARIWDGSNFARAM